MGHTPLRLYSTCPESAMQDAHVYLEKVKRAAIWSENAGFEGTLVYTDNRLVDPWQLAQFIISQTSSLTPLIAVQPAYMHPYSVAKNIATIAYLFSRSVAINWVAGGFKNDLESLGVFIPHDERYARLEDYARIVVALIEAQGDDQAVSVEGEYYQVRNLRLAPRIAADLKPKMFVSGSSEPGRAVAHRLGLIAVHYPDAPEKQEPGSADSTTSAVRIGVIARSTKEDAWQIAEERFPEQRSGQVAHKMAMKKSDSVWHKQLSDLAEANTGHSLYWLRPFEHYHTFCPYLVGSRDEVKQALMSYMRAGYFTYILDIPADESDIQAAAAVFQDAFAEVCPNEYR